MLNRLRLFGNFWNGYALLSTSCSKNGYLYFRTVSNIQFEFLNVFPIRNELSPAYFHLNLQNVRFKSKGKNKTKSAPDSDDEFSDDELSFDQVDEIEADGIKVKKFQVRSLRLDHILKTGFGIRRKKVEECLFSNKLQLNGKSLRKKGCEIKMGDEFELYPDSTDGNVSSKNVKFVVKKIEPNPEVLMYSIYISVHKT